MVNGIFYKKRLHNLSIRMKVKKINKLSIYDYILEHDLLKYTESVKNFVEEKFDSSN